MSRAVLASILLIVLAGGAFGQGVNPEEAFYSGNRLFKEADYAGSAKAYEAALAAGHESASLHFNLGNAYLFSGDHGRALYHYRLAQRLSPRDEDVAKNLAVARSRASDKLARPEAPRFVQALLWVHEKTTPGEALALFAALWCGGLLLLHLRLFRSGRWWLRLAVPLLVLGVLVGVSLGVRAAAGDEPTEGVILVPTVDVYTGPSDTAYEVYFKLHAGAEVQVDERRSDGWVKITVDAERKGYVPAADIGLL